MSGARSLGRNWSALGHAIEARGFLMRILAPVLVGVLLSCGQPAGADLHSLDRVACLGSSSTAGYGIATPYPALLDQRLGPEWRVDNFGRSGDRTADLLNRWSTVLKGRGYDWLILQGGGNDAINSVSAEDAMANFQVIIEDARAEGLHVVLVTLWPFRGYAGCNADCELRRRDLNRLLEAYCATHDVACTDTSAVFASPDNPELLDPRYDLGDHLHLNQDGAGVLADRIRARMP